MHDHFSSEMVTVYCISDKISVYAGRGNSKGTLNIVVINKDNCKKYIKFTFSSIPISKILPVTIDPISLAIIEIDENTGVSKIIKYTSKMDKPAESILLENN
jgi:hypothetical protein